MQQHIRDYLNAVEREFKTGIAAEHAYRPALKKLLEAIENNLTAVNDAKRSDIGAPDFHILRGQTTIGFVEAKDIDIRLDKTEKDEQMGRYLTGFANLILTDYLEFRWYVRGEHRQTVRIASVNKKKIAPDESAFDALEAMLRGFCQVVVPTVNTAQELAKRMAANAHLIRDLIHNDLTSKDPSPNLVSQREAFKKTLLPDINDAQFADMYAQTIAYGLFAARVNYQGDPQKFQLSSAGSDIPRTNPFLRKLFSNIHIDLGEHLVFIVRELADLLAHTDMVEILKYFGKSTRQEDPIVHFYETFLREYDPKLREQRGVYYTPEPVVNFIVRGVDHLLRTRFGKTDGLGDPDTLILDPATGTGTFLYFVIKHIYENGFVGQAGMWDGYVRDHLLRRIFGFELLMAPYAVAHMKLGMMLTDLGYQFSTDQRLGVYLTNTLEEAAKSSETLFAQFISEEADAASAVKRDKPIMVVLGNPPYSGHSANRSEIPVSIAKGDTYTKGWTAKQGGGASPIYGKATKALPAKPQPTFIGGLVRDYFFVDEKPLGERNPKWLQDDYVKFIRFGQHRIEQTGHGLLAFVTNHGYLDNPTFRGMRQHLMNTFTDIYILDLHGNSKKKEQTPDGGVDQNVFDIQQGVAIGIFVKEKGKTGPATVHHAELWGKRPDKYAALLAGDFTGVAWREVKPQDPFYLFSPQNLDLNAEYQAGWKVTDIFPSNVLGFQTHRDKFAIDLDQVILKRRIIDMRGQELNDEQFKRKYDIKDNRDWKLSKSRENLRKLDNWERDFISCTYRPFDHRPTYFSEITMDYPRRELMNHVAGRENSTLLLIRQMQDNIPYTHVLVSELPAIDRVFSASRGAATVFPLYTYTDTSKKRGLFDEDEGEIWPLSDKGRRPNLNPKFVHEMERCLGLSFITEGKGDFTATFGPEDIFDYAYAVLHNPTYRDRYAEFLKIDFPRLPLTRAVEQFKTLVGHGAELVKLHLMTHPALTQLVTTYPVKGDDVVAKSYPKYTEDDGRVYINKTQYIAGVPAAVWEFQVGGYQVLEKWLKDRRERVLTYDDLRHYQRIVVALKETIRVMDAIDDAIPAWPMG